MAEIAEPKKAVKKTAAKKAPAKKNPIEELSEIIERLRKKGGVQIHATIAWVDSKGDTQERSF